MGQELALSYSKEIEKERKKKRSCQRACNKIGTVNLTLILTPKLYLFFLEKRLFSLSLPLLCCEFQKYLFCPNIILHPPPTCCNGGNQLLWCGQVRKRPLCRGLRASGPAQASVAANMLCHLHGLWFFFLISKLKPERVQAPFFPALFFSGLHFILI